MISFLNVFRTQDRAEEAILPFWRQVTPTAFGVSPRYLPECIGWAVTESRTYPRVRMEFTDLPVDETARAE
jgi:hypothetical protein